MEAIQKFLNEHLIPNCKDHDQHHWRMKKTFNVEVDNFMKAHQKIWDHLYKKYSGRHVLPGAKKFMMTDEFELFAEHSNLVNDLLPARDVSLIFNLSM